MYEMTTSQMAEITHELEMAAQSIGLKRYSISVTRLPNIINGILRWRDDALMVDDNWVNISVCMTDRDCRTNEDFSNWKYDIKLRVSDMLFEIRNQHGGRIGLQR